VHVRHGGSWERTNIANENCRQPDSQKTEYQRLPSARIFIIKAVVCSIDRIDFGMRASLQISVVFYIVELDVCHE
jgi:hypothetical protein